MRFRLEDCWNFGSSWRELDNEFRGEYMGRLDEFLCDELASGGGFYPAEKDVFKAFELTALDEVKVVIVGQDPYADGRAMGLAFSVSKDKKLPRSLRHIYCELENDLGNPSARCGDLTPWAEQGVLLLNSILTVRPGAAKSHRKGGWWTKFTNQVLRLIDEKGSGVVFCLWGAQAESKRTHLTNSSCDHILTASHPSPRTFRKAFRDYPSFVGCGHFSQANRLLEAQDQKTVCWEITC